MEELTSDTLTEARLGPIRSLQSLLAVLRPNPRLSKTRPLWNLSKTELTRMFITTATLAGRSAGDTAVHKLGPHHMRKFAASYSAKMMVSGDISERKLLDRMGNKTMSVLKRTYIHRVPSLTVKAVVPVGTFSPAAHN